MEWRSFDMATANPGMTGGMPMASAPAAAAVPAEHTPLMGAIDFRIADPAPLGLAGFGLTTLLLSIINAQVIGTANEPAVLAMAIPFGGGAQLLAGMWAFRRNQTFAATAFTSYGAFWISFYLLINFFIGPVAAKGGADSANTIVGWYLCAWGIFTAYMFVASLGSARAVQVVFFLLALTFFALALGKWENSPDVWTKIGGWLGILTAIAAIYTSFADVTNHNLKRTVLPTG
jgi:succinate-acetate transporter protein